MPDTFGEDLVRLLPRLRRFALALARAPDVADDLVQATCEKALRNRDGFVPGTRMDAWLFRILRNIFLDRARRVRTEGTPIDVEDVAGDIADAAGHAGEDRLTLAATAKAIADLPEEQRSVLVLVCVEELSYREAAEVLSVPVGTVMSRLARARRKVAAATGMDGAPGRFGAGEEERT